MCHITNWLTEDNNLSIKYRTLTEICNKSITEYQELYDLLWSQKPILRMLQKQDENGLWESERKYYGSFLSLKYLTALAEHGLKKDKRIDNFVSQAINQLQEWDNKDDLSGCAAPLILRAFVMLGYHDREDVSKLISNFTSAQLYDGGFMCKRLLDKKPQRKSCYKATLASLLLYAECKRNDILPDNANALMEYFIKRNVFYSSDKSHAFFDENANAGWRIVDNFFPVEPMRIGLPLIVSALSILGIGNDSSMKYAWNFLEEKKDENKHQKLEGTLSKQPCSFGKVGIENKWMTFYALLAEKYCTI